MPKLLVTLPVYNESYILLRSVRAVHTWCSAQLRDFAWEIVIADNGSTDDTLERAKALAQELPQVTAFHTDEKGRGQVLRKVWSSYDADFYTYMDIDLAVALHDFRVLLSALENADVVIGSRLIPGSKIRRSGMRELTSRIYNLLVRIFLHLPTRDTQCGFKGIRRNVVTSILPQTKNDGWFFDTELIALAHHRGFRVQEIPVQWIEARDRVRQSTVKILPTILAYLRDIFAMRRRLSREMRRKT